MKAVKTELVEQLDEKEEEWNLEKKKVNDLKKQIECPVCLEVPRKGPVYACPNGHLVCQKCKRESCPTCREAMGNNKSLVAIAVIDKIPHECQFDGCKEEYPIEDIEDHEKACYYRLVACPNYGQCDQKVPLYMIFAHLAKKPCSSNGEPIRVYETTGFSKYLVSNRKTLERRSIHWKVATFFHVASDSLFALCVNKSGDNWQFTVVILASSVVCSDMNIEMEVYETDSPTDTRLSSKVRCHPCSIDQSVAEMKGLGLYVHHRFMEKIVSRKDSFKFTVSFSFL